MKHCKTDELTLWYIFNKKWMVMEGKGQNIAYLWLTTTKLTLLQKAYF
jgi:hypothetical protein